MSTRGNQAGGTGGGGILIIGFCSLSDGGDAFGRDGIETSAKHTPLLHRQAVESRILNDGVLGLP